MRSASTQRGGGGQGSGRVARPRHSSGRWALLHTGEAAEKPRAVEAACWMLLRRYGIVFRDLLAREANLPTWPEFLIAFRRLQDPAASLGRPLVVGFLAH